MMTIVPTVRCGRYGPVVNDMVLDDSLAVIRLAACDALDRRSARAAPGAAR
jgi:hypothetical protein